MGEVLRLIAADKDAQTLLDQAKKDGVKIFFSKGILGTETLACYETSPSYLEIKLSSIGEDGKIFTPISIAKSFAHELRHYWQYKKLSLTGNMYALKKRSPRMSFIFNRIAEADARAFEENFFCNVISNVAAPEDIDAERTRKISQTIPDQMQKT